MLKLTFSLNDLPELNKNADIHRQLSRIPSVFWQFLAIKNILKFVA